MACLAIVLAACSAQAPSVYQTERFDPVSYFSRSFDEASGRSCDAARRALLSQGYVVDELRKDAFSARKSFQPREETHVQLVFSIVCAADGKRAVDGSTLFVSALQERYSLKKTSSSASLGVGPIGSVSLPFGASSDSLIKTGSETIPAEAFYDRFFELVQHYLANHSDPASAPTIELPAPRPLPAAPASRDTGGGGAGPAAVPVPAGEASPVSVPAPVPAVPPTTPTRPTTPTTPTTPATPAPDLAPAVPSSSPSTSETPR